MEILISILLIVAVSFIAYYKWSFTYWKKRNVPHKEPAIPFGTTGNPLQRKDTIGVRLKRVYDEFKALGHKHAGEYLFASPLYVPIDPEYIKNIMQKDFSHFTERGFYYNAKDDPLSANLFAIGGHQWRSLRTKLTPTFTSGKMKMMFETLLQCGYQMQDAMEKFTENKQVVDIKEVLACYTTDVIGSCAFGLDCNSFTSPDAEFRKYGKKIFDPMSYLQSLHTAFAFSKPNLARMFGIRFFRKECTEFFMQVVKDTLTYRANNKFVRKDMLQILIDLQEELKQAGETPLTIQQMSAQAFIFFAAGFETSSTTMTFCLYELSLNPSIQETLRNEVNQVLAKHNGKATYEAIAEMKYMGQVVDETLRKYPALSFITRDCVEDYKVEGIDLVLKKGTHIWISVMGLHHDADYYPDPERFDPERFSEENKQQRRPFTYMPFGEGPRICLGLRFGTMQTKVGLALLLRKFKFSLNEKTEVPITFDPYSPILTSKTAIFLDVEKVH